MASMAPGNARRAASPTHLVRVSDHHKCPDEAPDPAVHRKKIEPWLSALFQAEHLNLLVGSGLTTAVLSASSRFSGTPAPARD